MEAISDALFFDTHTLILCPHLLFLSVLALFLDIFFFQGSLSGIIVLRMFILLFLVALLKIMGYKIVSLVARIDRSTTGAHWRTYDISKVLDSWLVAFVSALFKITPFKRLFADAALNL